MTTWIKDNNGNKCSIEYFGSKEAAQTALDSLDNCRGCINCSRCSDCSDCYGCSECSRCFRCSGCSDCSRCFRCSDCSRCFRCSDCSRCSRCFRCSVCFDCFRCSGCSGKNDTSDNPITTPAIKDIHQAIYAAATQPAALEMGDWHTCENTHCRAGWVVTLAGEEGAKLESRFDTCLAALMIYDASSSLEKISPVRFFENNKDALKDMKRLAELESA